jgi:hypothetical protein
VRGGVRGKFRAHHTPQESHEDGARLGKGYSGSAREDAVCALKRRRIENEAHLPPTVAVKIVPVDDLDALASAQGDLVFVFRDKVVSGIDVFHHDYCEKEECSAR